MKLPSLGDLIIGISARLDEGETVSITICPGSRYIVTSKLTDGSLAKQGDGIYGLIQMLKEV